MNADRIRIGCGLSLLYTVSDIERMADHAMAIAKAGQEMDEKKIEFSKQARGELAVLEQAVLDIVNRTFAPVRQDSGHCRLLQFLPRISATVFHNS